MRRRLFTSIAVSSAMILLLAAGFWVRGFFVGDMFFMMSCDAGSGRYVKRSVQVGGGRVICFQYDQLLTPQEVAAQGPFRNQPWTHTAFPPDTVARSYSRWPWMIFGYGPVTIAAPTGGAITAPVVIGWDAGVRLLAVVVLCAILPGVWTFQFSRRRRRSQPGCCPTCGYDLRATPVGGGQLLEVCPECGRPAGVAPVG